MRSLRALVTWSMLAASAAAQFQGLQDEIRGQVRAADGTPVAGAMVSIEVYRGHDDAFSLTAEALLRRFRAPRTRTGHDGRYAFVVLPDHREVSAIGLDWWLFVERPGFTPWRERLPRGLHGYLGSTVTLAPADPADEVTFVAPPAQVAAGLAVARKLGEALVVSFGDDGRARVLLPRVPTPVQCGFFRTAHVEWTLRGVGNERVQRPEHRLVAGATDAPFDVARLDGAVATGTRALIWNGIDARIVPLRSGEPRPAGALLAVGADGCRMAAASPLSPLSRLPSTPARRIRIVDPAGRSVAGARGLLLPLAAWRPTLTRQVGASVSGGALWSAPRQAESDGGIDLGDLPADAPAVLVVGAEGYEPLEVLDPHGVGGEGTVCLVPRPSAAIEVTVVDAAGKSVEGARLCLPDLAYAPAAVLGEDLLTDASGVVRAAGLRPGDYAIFVMRRGYISRMAATRMVAGKAQKVGVTLTEGNTSAWVVRDSVDRTPRPFAAVMGSVDGANRSPIFDRDTARQVAVFSADADGRLVLPHGIEPRFTALGGTVDLPTEPSTRGFGAILMPTVRPLDVMPGRGLQLAVAKLHEPGGRAVNMQSGVEDGVILFAGSGQWCSVELRPAGSVTLSAMELDGLARDAGSGLRRWRVDLPRVNVELAADCEMPERWWGLPVRDGTCAVGSAQAVVFCDLAGGWRLTDPEVDGLWFVHPVYAPAWVGLTGEQRAGTAAIRVPAVAGGRLRVDIARDGVAAMFVKVTVAPEAGAGPRFSMDVPGMVAGGTEGMVELPAVESGRWVVSVQGSLLTKGNKGNRPVVFARTVSVEGSEVVVVAEGDGK